MFSPSPTTGGQQLVVRLLRGAPASVLLALLEQPGVVLGPRDLAFLTGYSVNSVKAGAALLERLGLAEATGGGWAWPATAPQGWPLPLSGPPASIDAPLTTTDTLIPSGDKQQQASNDAAQIAHMLTAAGIGRNSAKMRALLAARPPVDYVRAHVTARAAALKRGEEYSVGLLITRLLDGDPAPVAPGCRCGRCEDCRARTYARYADVIVR